MGPACKQWWIDLPDLDLANLVEGTPEFWAYIREMRWAQTYALLNREEMMDRVVTCFSEWVRGGLIPGSMGAASYVVAGKGYPPSLNSAPHGAGRAYSRTAARKTFTREQLQRR